MISGARSSLGRSGGFSSTVGSPVWSPICGSGFFLFVKDFEKIMVAKEVFVSCYNFNPIRVKHASIYVKNYLYSNHKKVVFKVSYKIIRSRGGSRSFNSDLRLRGAGGNIFGSKRERLKRLTRMSGFLKPGGIKVAARDDRFKGDESKRVPRDWNTRGWMWTVMSWKDKNERYR